MYGSPVPLAPKAPKYNIAAELAPVLELATRRATVPPDTDFSISKS